MVFSTGLQTSQRILSLSVLALFVFVGVSSSVAAQGAIDYTGTGGKHTIQGRIYFPSGRSADAPGLKISLESVGYGNLSVFADSNGSFTFKNLTAGSYAIVIDGTDYYAAVRESVYIDDPGSSNIRGRSVVGNAPRIIIVPIHLLSKDRVTKKPGVVNAALARVPEAALQHYRRALVSANSGNVETAIEQLKSAIAIHPEFPLALNELGVQYLNMGQVAKAAEALAAAVRIVPDEIVPRLHYGIALLNQKKFAESEQHLRAVLQKNSSLPTAHMYLGLALLSQKKLREAEKELLAAVSSNSSEVALAHRYLGGIYWANREYKRAADQLDTYLKLFPKATDAERTKATIKELRGKQ